MNLVLREMEEELRERVSWEGSPATVERVNAVDVCCGKGENIRYRERFANGTFVFPSSVS